MMEPLKNLSNFEMPLINCEINRILPWSENCFIMVNVIAVKYQQ